MKAKVLTVLLAMALGVGGVAAYNLFEVTNSRESILEQQQALDRLQAVSSLRDAFNDLRYWTLDMANTLDEQSEKQAVAASGRAFERLAKAGGFAEGLEEELTPRLNAINDGALNALDYYMFDERREGNLEMEGVRVAIGEVNTILEGLVERYTEAVAGVVDDVGTSSRSAVLASWGTIAGLALGVSLAWAVVYLSALRPLARVTRAVNALSGGNLEVAVPCRDHLDEIGQMARALEVFRENAVQARRYAAEQAEQGQREAARSQRLEGLAEGFDASVTGAIEQADTALEVLRTCVESLHEIATHNEASTEDASNFSRQSLESAESAAAAAEQLSAAIREIGRQALQTSQTTTEVRGLAQHTNEQVRALDTAAAKIGDVVGLIRDIADKTNLLALNATIEAARAGEAGKGFAVVANEVKNLANQTAKATEDISANVATVQQETGAAVAAMSRISTKIDEVDQATAAISGSVEQQQGAISEISRNMQEVSEGAGKLTGSLKHLSESAGKTRLESDQMASAVDNVGDSSAGVRRTVKHFLGDLKQAS